MTACYIYILQNEAFAETHLKIGRTVYDPADRASDLSRATGVPTPFEVAWSQRTVDCVMAERLIHEQLAEYRTNPRREFFDLELGEAVKVVQAQVKRVDRGRLGGALYYPEGGNDFSGALLRFPLVLIAGVFRVVWFVIVRVFELTGALVAGLFRFVTGSFRSRTKRRKRPRRRR